MWLDSHLIVSLKIYKAYVTDSPVKISDLFAQKFSIACSIGPYDTFGDSRFYKTLNEAQRRAAVNTLDQINESSFGDNNFLLIGFSGDSISYVYVSRYFSNTATRKIGGGLQDCVSNTGQLKVEEIEQEIIAIELDEK